MSKREGQRKREKQAPRWAGSPMRGSILGSQDHELSLRQTLNQLSHSGAFTKIPFVKILFLRYEQMTLRVDPGMSAGFIHQLNNSVLHSSLVVCGIQICAWVILQTTTHQGPLWTLENSSKWEHYTRFFFFLSSFRIMNPITRVGVYSSNVTFQNHALCSLPPNLVHFLWVLPRMPELKPKLSHYIPFHIVSVNSSLSSTIASVFL